MLIESVDYRQNNGGSIATLNLVDPRAYDGQGAGGGKGNKSGSNWNFDGNPLSGETSVPAGTPPI